MEQIILTKYVDDRLFSLIDILHYKNYFSYRADAKRYVDDVYAFIYTIPKQKLHNCQNPKHGSHYCKFTPNKNTTWYITFDREADTYLIKNIFNNHTSDYPEFIKSIS